MSGVIVDIELSCGSKLVDCKLYANNGRRLQKSNDILQSYKTVIAENRSFSGVIKTRSLKQVYFKQTK